MKINKTHQGKLISLMLICLMFVMTETVYAQKGKRVKKAEDDVELVCAGDGKTLDEAVKMALRSGLEQTYGTFVSSNTTILNDDLIKDEIISLSTGNVRGYEIVSQNQNSNGTWNAVVKAVFSTGKLVSYVKSKGGSTELAGGVFAMYAKMEKMNEEAEVKIIHNLQQQINSIAPTVFDYSIEAGQPRSRYSNGAGGYFVPVEIKGRLNSNIYNLHDVFYNTIQSLSMTPDEAQKRIEAGYEIYAVIYYHSVRDKQDGDDLLYEQESTKDDYSGDVVYGNKSRCGHMGFRRVWSIFGTTLFNGRDEYRDDHFRIADNVYYLRTKELKTLLKIGFLKINPIGAFVISDGKRTWNGENLGMPRAHNRLFTCCFKKGELWFDEKISLYYDLDQLSEVKEITIKPISSQ